MLKANHLFVLLAIVALGRPAAAQALKPLAGLSGPIHSVAFSADGTKIIAGGKEGSIAIWDRTTGKLIRTLPGHRGPVTSLATGHRQNLLASGGADGQLLLRPIVPTAPLNRLGPLSGTPVAIGVSAAGLIGSVNSAGSVQLWNADGQKSLGSLKGSTTATQSIIVSDLPPRVVIIDQSGVMHGWDSKSGKQLATTSVGVSPTLVAWNASLVAAGADGALRFLPWPSEKSPPAFSAHGEAITSVATTADGTLLVTGGGKEVHLHDANTGKLLRRFAGQVGVVSCIAMHPQGKWLVTGNATGQIRIWSLQNNLAFDLLGHTGVIHSVDFNRVKPELLSAGADGSIRIWRLPEPPAQVAQHNRPIVSIATLPSGDVISASLDGSVQHTKPDGQSAKEPITLQRKVTRTSVSPQGWMAIGDAQGRIRLWDAKGKPAGELSGHRAAISGLGFDEQSTMLVSSAADGTVLHWSLPIESPRLIPLMKGTVPRVAEFVSQGKLILLAAKDKKLMVIEPSSQQKLGEWSTKHDTITALANHETSGLVASADKSGRIDFWPVGSQQRPISILAHPGPIEAIQFHPTGQFLASAGRDGTIRLWNVIRTARLDKDNFPVAQVAANPSGSVVVFAAKDGTVRAVNGSTAATNWQTKPAKPRLPSAISFRKDSGQVAVGFQSGHIALYDGSTGAEEGFICAHQGPVVSLSYDYRHRLLVSGGRDGTARVWRIPATPPKTLVRPAANTTDVILASDGTLGLRINNQGEATRFAGNVQEAIQLKLPADLTIRKLSPDKSKLAFGTKAGRLLIVDVTKGTTLAQLEVSKSAISDLSWNSGSSQIAVAGSDGQVSIWPVVAKPKLVRRIAAHKAGFTCVRFASSAQIITAGVDQTAKTWKIADGKLLSTYTGKHGAVIALALDRTRKWLATLCAKGEVVIWKRADGKVAGSVTAGTSQHHMAIANDGQRLFTVGNDAAIHLWDIRTRKQLERFDAHRGPVTGLSLVANQRAITFSSLDGSMRTWTPSASAVQIEHKGGVNAVQFSRHGKNWLITGGADNRIRFTDETGKSIRVIQLPAAVASLAVHPKQAMVVTSTVDGKVSNWRINNGKRERQFAAGKVYKRLSFDTAGRRLAGCATDRLDVLQWSDFRVLESHPVGHGEFVSPDRLLTQSAGGVAIQPLSLHRLFRPGKGAVRDVTFMSSNYLLTAGDDKVIRQWTISNGRLNRSFTGHSGSIHSIQLAQSGTRLVTASDDKTVRVWNVSNAQTLARIAHKTPIAQIAVSPHASAAKVVTVNDQQEVQVWDLNSGQRLQKLGKHPSVVRQVMISADERTVVSLGDEDEIREWPLSVTNLAIGDNRKIQHLQVVRGTGQYVTVGSDKLVKLWDVNNLQVRSFSGSSTPLLRIAVSPDGQWIAAGGNPNYTQRSIYRWDLGNGTAQSAIQLSAAITAVCYRPDSRHLAIATADKRIHILTSLEGQPLESLTLPVIAHDISYSSDGKHLFLGGVDGKLYQVTPRMTRRLLGHEGVVRSAKWGAKGVRIFSAGTDNSIRMWDLATGSTIRSYTGSQSGAVAIALDGPNKSLVAISADKTVRVWPVTPADAPESPVVAPLWSKVHASALHGVTFSVDGRRVFSGGGGGRVQMWDVKTGELLEQFVGHKATVHSVATRIPLKGDETSWQVVSVSADKSIRAWTPSVQAAKRLHTGAIQGCATFADKIVTVGADKRLVIWSAQKTIGECIATEPLTHVACSKDGSVLAASGATKLWLWAIRDITEKKGAVQPKLTLDLPSASGISMSPDASHISLSAANVIQRFRLDTKQEKWTLTPLTPLAGHSSTIKQLVRFPHGLVSLANDKMIFSWASANGGRWMRAAHVGAITSIAFDASDRSVFSAGRDGKWHAHRTLNGKRIVSAGANQQPLLALAVRPNAASLLTVGEDRVLRVWQSSGAETKQASVGKSPVKSVGIDAAGKQVLLSGPGTQLTMRLFSALPLNTKGFVGHKGQVVRGVFSRSGNRIISLDESGFVIVWDAKTRKSVFKQQLTSQAHDMALPVDEKTVAVATKKGVFLIPIAKYVVGK